MKKNKIKFSYRNNSVLTGKKRLENLFSIKNFPVFIGVTSRPQREDVFFDMNFGICKDTGIIQLKKVLSPELVYSTYHSEALGKVWEKHHIQFINFLKQFYPMNILEIGGSNGFMAKKYVSKNKLNKWIIVEPNPSIKNTKKIKVIKKIFNSDFKLNENVDTIVHSHTLEHIYEPRDFLTAVRKILPEKGLNIFSVPNLFAWIKNRQSNVLNFEHTIFLTEYYIDELLKMYGFRIIKKKHFGEHSIFYATQKTENAINKYNGENKYVENKKMFESYFNYYLKIINSYNKKINNFDGEVYVFGAHVFSQFLLSLGLSQNIFGILDNSKLKQGKRLYGNSFFVYPLSIVKKGKIAVILRAGLYQKEIKKQLLEINPSVTIWE